MTRQRERGSGLLVLFYKNKNTFPFYSSENTSKLQSYYSYYRNCALLPYSKKEKCSYKRIRVIKTKEQNYFSACTEQSGRQKYCIFYCRPLQVTKTTLIGCLTKTDQDQQLK